MVLCGVTLSHCNHFLRLAGDRNRWWAVLQDPCTVNTLSGKKFCAVKEVHKTASKLNSSHIQERMLFSWMQQKFKFLEGEHLAGYMHHLFCFVFYFYTSISLSTNVRYRVRAEWWKYGDYLSTLARWWVYGCRIVIYMFLSVYKSVTL